MVRNDEGPEEAAEAVSRPDGPGIRLKSIDPTHMAPVEHVQGAGLRAAGQLLGELEALRFASREAPTGLADDEVADSERDRGVARAPHGVDVAPLLEELGDALGLDVSERTVALDQTGDLAAIAGAAARVTGLGHRGKERHALLPCPSAVAGVAAVGEVTGE